MTTQVDFDNRIFSVNEAATHLKISRALLYRLIAAGEIRPTRINSRTLFSGKTLSAFIAARS